MSAVVVHGQKTVDRSGELLPPAWVRSHEPGVGRAQATTPGDSRVSLVDSSGTVRSKLIALVDGARGVVCVCSFLIADEDIVKAMLRANERGVRVYLLTASETQLLKEPRTDSEFDVERLQDHIKTLRLMAGQILVRTGEHFHSKFVLTDPNESGAKGFLLTANLTSEALTRNVEIAVELTRAEIQDVFRQFLMGFWEESSAELMETGGLNKAEPTKEFATEEPRNLPCTVSRITTLKSAIDGLIGEAKSEILVSSFGFDLQHETTQKLIAAAKEGKKVRIFARPRLNKTCMSSLIAFREAGAEVRGHPWLHAKCVVADTDEGWAGLVMTANFEARGLNEGFETGVPLKSKDAESLLHFAEEWGRSFPFELLLNKRVGEIDGEVTVWMNDELRKLSVRPRGEMDLGEFRVKRADEMRGFTPDFSRVADRRNELYHQQTFKWTVLPPKGEGPARSKP